MSGAVAVGVALTMLAGVMAGNCMLPLKFARRWRWENVWLVFSLFSLLVLPWTIALSQVHHLFAAYRSVPFDVMIAPALFGAGWGVAQILFGISVQRLGLGVAYAVIIGLGAVFGTLVPLFLGQRGVVAPNAMAEILAGVVVMVLGIALTAWGGQTREHAASSGGPLRQGYVAAVLVAVLCGLMAPMLNYAFAFGQGLAVAAVDAGNSPVAAGYAVWPIALLGGLYLLRRNHSWKAFSEHEPDGLWAVLMAVLWMGSMAVYGVASVYLGALGTSIGWGLFQIFMIITATLSGLLTAEWKQASRNGCDAARGRHGWVDQRDYSVGNGQPLKQLSVAI